MKKLNMNKTTRQNYLTYGLVIVAFVIIQIFMGAIPATLRGMLVPICAYVIMAISLNLTVGVLGELSLGHAGFMSVGAFTGTTVAIMLQDVVPSGGLRLLIAVVVATLFGALAGFLIGIPVLRLQGDYLAIVTLAFGEIIKSIFNNLYLGMDSEGLHASLLSDKTNLAEDGKMLINGPMGIGGIQKILYLYRRVHHDHDYPPRGLPPHQQPHRPHHHGHSGQPHRRRERGREHHCA